MISSNDDNTLFFDNIVSVGLRESVKLTLYFVIKIFELELSAKMNAYFQN